MTEPYHPQHYWDNIAASIAARKDIKIIAGDDEPYYRYKRKRFLELLGKMDFANKTLLEVGSGPGGNLDFIYNKGCRSITGVDISGQMVALSKELLKGKNIDVLKINGTDLPFKDNTFDCVFTSTVLQHITDERLLQQLCIEMCRVSKGEVWLFERVEGKIKGHESNLGRPISYYEQLLKPNGFELTGVQAVPIQVSFYVSGVLRKVFNSKLRKEGEPLSKLSVALQKAFLPVTSMLDRVVPSKRDVTLLKFNKKIINS